MKNTLKTSLAALSALAIAVGIATAGDKPEGKARPEGGADLRAKMLERFDKDGDGKLSEAERAEAKKAMGDRDGKGGGDRKTEILKRFDKDGDGQLNEAERAEARKAMEGRKGQRPEGGKPRPEGGDRKPKSES